MATMIERLRGTAAELASFVLPKGVWAHNDTNDDIHIGDGITPGGKGILARAIAANQVLASGSAAGMAPFFLDLPEDYKSFELVITDCIMGGAAADNHLWMQVSFDGTTWHASANAYVVQDTTESGTTSRTARFELGAMNLADYCSRTSVNCLIDPGSAVGQCTSLVVSQWLDPAQAAAPVTGRRSNFATVLARARKLRVFPGSGTFTTCQYSLRGIK